jgi:predicted nucleic acid-binding protein
MRNLFLDTNILVDLLADRKPFSKFAVEIFSAAEKKQVILYTSSHSIATTYYLLKKYLEDKSLREALTGLIEYVKVIPIDSSMINKGLKSKQRDFEDALQLYAASSIQRMDCIVTRNIKDFKGSEIPALSPDEICAQL